MSNNKGPCSAATSENCGGCGGKFSNTEHKCRIDGCNAFICSLCNPLEKGFHCEDNFNFGNSYMCYTCYIKGTGSTEGRPHEWKYDKKMLEQFTGSIVVPVTMQKAQQQQLPFPKLSKHQILPCSKNMAKLQIAENFFLCLLIVINIWRRDENYTVLTKNSIPSISTIKNVNSKRGRNGWEKFFACTDDTIIKYANVVDSCGYYICCNHCRNDIKLNHQYYPQHFIEHVKQVHIKETEKRQIPTSAKYFRRSPGLKASSPFPPFQSFRLKTYFLAAVFLNWACTKRV